MKIKITKPDGSQMGNLATLEWFTELFMPTDEILSDLHVRGSSEFLAWGFAEVTATVIEG